MNRETCQTGSRESVRGGPNPLRGHPTMGHDVVLAGSPVLGEHEVHVWRVRLDVSEPELERRTSWLSPEERGRASRFHFDRDRRHYLAHRGALRWVLSGYLSARPGQIRLERDRRGKPCLAGEDEAGLQFSVSHSGSLGLYAFRRGLPVGVDVEWITPGFEWEEVATTAFSGRERRALIALPDEQKLEGFFAVWTRKEALSKAVGLGLRAGLASLEVPTYPECVGWSRRSVEIPGGKVDCSLVDLSPGDGCRGALALVGGRTEVASFEWVAGDRLSSLGVLMSTTPGNPLRWGEHSPRLAHDGAILSERAA